MSQITTYEATVIERRGTRDIERAVKDTLQDQVDNDLARGAQSSANVLARLADAKTRLSLAEAALLSAEEALALLRMNLGGKESVRPPL